MFSFALSFLCEENQNRQTISMSTHDTHYETSDIFITLMVKDLDYANSKALMQKNYAKTTS